MIYNKRFVKRISLFFIFIIRLINPLAAPADETDAGNVLHYIINTDESTVVDQILYQALQRIGYKMTMDAIPMQYAILMANSGEYDALANQARGTERTFTNLVMVGEQLGVTGFQAFVRDGSNLAIRSWADLSGLRIGHLYQKTYIISHLPKDIAGSIQRETFYDLNLALLAGECDVVVTTSTFDKPLITARGVKYCGTIDLPPTFTFVNKKFEDIVPAFSKSLAQMKADGTYSDIVNGRRYAQGRTHSVLHISSFYAEDLWDSRIKDGIISGLGGGDSGIAGGDVIYYNVPLYSNRFFSEYEQAKNAYNSVRTMIMQNPPDVIIATDRSAILFVCNYYYTLFSDIPVVLYGIKGEIDQLWQLGDNYTAIWETAPSAQTADIIKKILPETERLFIVNDYTANGLAWRADIERTLGNKYNGMDILYNKNLSYADLISDVSALPKNTAILTGYYAIDADGFDFSRAQLESVIMSLSDIPVFGMQYGAIGNGQIGGKYIDPGSQGTKLGKAAKDIISGNFADISYDTTESCRWIFDEKAVVSRGINKKLLPSGVEFINYKPSLRESNPEVFILILIAGVLSVFLITGLSIFILIMQRKNRRINKYKVDIAEIKKVQDELAEQNRQLTLLSDFNRTLFDNAPVGLTIFNENYKFIDCNENILKMFGVTKMFYASFFGSGEHNPEYQPDGSLSYDKALDIIKRVVLNGEIIKTEWVHSIPSGGLLPVELTLTRIKQNDKYVGLAYVYDMREQNKLKDDLKEALRKEENASKVKMAFLANMSHEIRTPMNSIIGFTELAQNAENPPKTKEYLANIEESSKWLLNIINDILDVSKIESGKTEIEHIPFALHDIFSYCQTMIAPKVAEKGLSLYCYAEPAIGKKLIGDPVKLRQTLINLLSNAVKFTNTGTIKYMASVKSSNSNSVRMRFEVKDSGIGMTRDQIDKIFEPFVQADESVSRKYGGTGLGLSICKNYIEMMGGKLEVESAPGVGSKFSFEISFDMINAPVSEMEAEDNVDIVKMPLFKGNVLICEDNYMNQRVITDHLEKVGLKTVVAADGQEGVDIIAERMQKKQKPFDLIFMDIHMPVMDGMEAAAKITALGVKTPIVALTANVMLNDMDLYTKSGMSDILSKPFTSQELWKCLLRHLTPESFSDADTNRADARAKGQLELIFVKNNQKTFKEIKKALNNGNVKLAHRLVHTLKTNAGHIEEKKLQQAAGTAESMLAGGKNGLAKEQLDILENELKAVLEKLAPLLAEHEKSKKTPLGEDEARKLLMRLELLLQNRSPDCIDLLADLSSIPGTEELARHVEKLKYKHALAALSVFRQREEKYNG